MKTTHHIALAAAAAIGLIGCAGDVPGVTRPLEMRHVVAPDAVLELIWNDGQFTEGPASNPADGWLYFSDIGDRIMRYHPTTGQVEVYRQPSGRANGLIFTRDGRLIAAEGAWGGNRRISITAKDGAARTLADRYDGQRFNSPNDLTIDASGRVYFTDPRYVGDEQRELDFEGVFVVHPDGRVGLATRDVQKPNGIIAAPGEGGVVYVADNNGLPGGARHLLAFKSNDDGTLTNKRILHDFGTQRGIDGMALDRRGILYATAGSGDTAGIYVFDREGRLIGMIPTPGDPTNCTFDARDPSVLYITAQGPDIGQSPRSYGLYRIRLRGRP